MMLVWWLSLLLVFWDLSLADRDNATEEDTVLSRAVMKYWANFARSGNPNGAGLVTWPRYDLSEPYLEIGIKQKVARKLKEKAVGFWTKILPEKVAKEKGHAEL